MPVAAHVMCHAFVPIFLFSFSAVTVRNLLRACHSPKKYLK